jgi:membrane-bound lytic murein transglycosylase C
MAAERAARYAANPKAVESDLARFRKQVDAFRKVVGRIWGRDEAREPTPKEYVKYSRNYLCRAMVDFDAGLVIVETLDQAEPLPTLRRALVTTLLAPADPRAVDLWSDAEVALGGTPFLLGEVVDHEGKAVGGEWRAARFADWLIANRLQEREIDGKTARFVSVPMVRDHLSVRAAKYRAHVTAHAARFKVSPNLVYAVIRTESDFNPFAVSAAPAFGLMQIVPASAGREVRGFLTGREEEPSRELLFDPEQNILYGAAYLHLLEARHLARVADPVARQYCQIAAYNTGPGNLLRTFDKDRDKAVARINALSPAQVFETLRRDLPYEETRRYLVKVTQAQKEFVAF